MRINLQKYTFFAKHSLFFGQITKKHYFYRPKEERYENKITCHPCNNVLLFYIDIVPKHSAFAR